MADDSNPNFQPTEFITSKLRFYSIGIVAENKLLSSHEIEVTPVEELPMTNGELSANSVDYKGKAVDAGGKAYSASTESQVTLKASWLRFGSSNRLTSPDVRRGEVVMIYQFGDADKYYWVVLKDDSKLRKLETVIWAISATKDETKPTDASTSYYFEISSHKKLLHIHTSNKNGEPFMYDVQLNTGEGYLTITDDVGNFIHLNSGEQRIELKNGAGSHYDMHGPILDVTTPESINFTTQTFTVKSTTTTMDSTSTKINAGSNLDIHGSAVTMLGDGSVTIASPATSVN